MSSTYQLFVEFKKILQIDSVSLKTEEQVIIDGT